jgi:hypothetical protein
MSKFTPQEEAEMAEARRRAKETLSNSHLPISFFFDGDRPEVKEEMRIPVASGHRFRRDLGTDSGMTRALNPERSGH